jgi:hypothetical protein
MVGSAMKAMSRCDREGLVRKEVAGMITLGDLARAAKTRRQISEREVSTTLAAIATAEAATRHGCGVTSGGGDRSPRSRAEDPQSDATIGRPRDVLQLASQTGRRAVVPGAARPQRSQVADEPPGSEARDDVEPPGLLEEVAGTGNDDQLLLTR